jgi:hypothetical protein
MMMQLALMTDLQDRTAYRCIGNRDTRAKMQLLALTS